MKAFRLNTVITGIRSKIDKSLGLTLSTPELSSDERSGLMELQGINLDIFIKPIDTPTEEIVQIDKDLNTKTQSQRIRSVLFLLWRQEGELEDFANFYKRKTEKYIEFLKSKLD